MRSVRFYKAAQSRTIRNGAGQIDYDVLDKAMRAIPDEEQLTLGDRRPVPKGRGQARSS